jgi:hypothetical protein
MRSFLFAIVCLTASIGAAAADTGGCQSLAWPLDVELQWTKAANPQAVASGAKLDAPPEKALAVSLAPIESVAFPIPPTSHGKSKEAGRFGALIEFGGVPQPGTYQISLSDVGWIDVVQGGTALHSKAHTGKSDCEGLRKSVRFEIGQGPFTLELSGARTDSIKVTMRKAQ